MKKVNIKIIVSMALIIILGIIMTTSVFASGSDPMKYPSMYNPFPTTSSAGNFLTKAGMVLGWIRYIGIIVAVVVLAIIGLVYMFSSVEGKAEYKKKILPYVLGCFLIIGISLVLNIVADLSKETPAGGGVKEGDQIREIQ